MRAAIAQFRALVFPGLPVHMTDNPVRLEFLMSAPLRLVIFDIDGTLVDSQHSILASMRHAFETMGRPVPAREAALGVVGLSLPEAMAVLAPDAALSERHDLARHYRTGPATHRGNGKEAMQMKLFDGAHDTVEGFDRAGYLLSAATGKSRRGLDRFLSHCGYDRIFLATQCADDAPSKPHPQMVMNCLAGTGVEPANAVMIGDTEYDMTMGRAAGVRTIGVSWGYQPVDRVRRGGADAIAESFEELTHLVAGLWSTS